MTSFAGREEEVSIQMQRMNRSLPNPGLTRLPPLRVTVAQDRLEYPRYIFGQARLRRLAWIFASPRTGDRFPKLSLPAAASASYAAMRAYRAGGIPVFRAKATLKVLADP